MSNAVEDEVLFERIGEHVALVTLNRPSARNAVNGAVALAIERFTKQVEEDKSIRVAVLAATGDIFCAGLDLKAVAAGKMWETGDPGWRLRGLRLCEEVEAMDRRCAGACSRRRRGDRIVVRHRRGQRSGELCAS